MTHDDDDGDDDDGTVAIDIHWFYRPDTISIFSIRTSINFCSPLKVWDFESIDNADTDDVGSLFEVEPMYELKV
jgi:hypothetical protein